VLISWGVAFPDFPPLLKTGKVGIEYKSWRYGYTSAGTPQDWVSSLMGMVYYCRLAIGILYKSVVDSTARNPIDI